MLKFIVLFVVLFTSSFCSLSFATSECTLNETLLSNQYQIALTEIIDETTTGFNIGEKRYHVRIVKNKTNKGLLNTQPFIQFNTKIREMNPFTFFKGVTFPSVLTLGCNPKTFIKQVSFDLPISFQAHSTGDLGYWKCRGELVEKKINGTCHIYSPITLVNSSTLLDKSPYEIEVSTGKANFSTEPTR